MIDRDIKLSLFFCLKNKKVIAKTRDSSYNLNRSQPNVNFGCSQEFEYKNKHSTLDGWMLISYYAR